jgi:hypothetical protein
VSRSGHLRSYDWRAEPNAAHLARVLEAYQRRCGSVCEGWSLDGCERHPSELLVAVALVPMAVGGRADGRVLVLCPFCARRHLALTSRTLGNLETG